MTWREISVSVAIGTLVPQGAAWADPSAGALCPLVAGMDAGAEAPGTRLQPFRRPGWSRSSEREQGRVRDEERTWPTPLIAPPEPYNPAMFAGFAAPTSMNSCFAPGSSPTLTDLRNLNFVQRGGGSFAPRYVTVQGWPSRTVTWSLVPDGTTTSLNGDPDEPSSLFATMDAEFSTRAQWIGLIEACLARWSQVTGIEFVRVRYNGQEWDDGVAWNVGPGAAGLRGDIRIGARFLTMRDGKNRLAVGLYPTNTVGVFTPEGGNLVFGEQWVSGAEWAWSDSSDNYRLFKTVFTHEIGHVMGLEHSCPNNTNTKLMESTLVNAFDGPQHDDIRGGQALYGDIYEPNDSAAAATPRGAIGGSGSSVVGTMPASTFVTAANTAVTAIVPGTDQDWYEYFLTVNTTVSVVVAPTGLAYSAGDCFNADASINSKAAQTLTVSIIGANGTTVLGTANAPGPGQNATLSNISVPSGVFYVRVRSTTTGTQTQMYTVSLATGTPARPANDDCANAQPVNLGNTDGNNGGALLDGSSTLCGVSAFSDVWYSYTPSCDGGLTIDTCGSSLDTVIGVYAACGASPVVCNDNGTSNGGCPGGVGSSVSLQVDRGQTYLIRVAGRTTTQNNFFLQLTLVRPFNDTCATAESLPSGDFDQDGSSCGATIIGSNDDVYMVCGTLLFSRVVWYRYVPACTGELTVDACDAGFDTGLALHTGVCGALTQIACNDQASPVCSPGNIRGARLKAQVTAGTAYYIRVAGLSGASGRFRLRGGVGQPNDTCDGASSITPGTYSVNLCNARREVSPPCAPTSTAPDVFFRYVPAISGVMTLNTCGSPAATALEVLTGTCASPVSVACNDDQGSTICPAGPTTARIDMNVTAGTPYLIRFVGSGGASTLYTLRLNQAPSNDLCVNATLITNGSVTGTTDGAARETDPSCSPVGAAPDVWYRWVAPCTGIVTVNTCGSGFDTVVSVLTGPNCSVLTQVACNDDTFAVFCGLSGGTISQSALETPVTAGTTYYIRVSGKGGASGAFTLTVGDKVANETCATASTVTAGTTAFDTRCASPDGSAPCIGSASSPDIWYRYVAGCNGAVWMSTCPSNFDSVLSVSTGACATPTSIACNDDQGSLLCPSNFRASRVAFRGAAGTAYLVRVGGVLTGAGTGNLSITCCPPDYDANGALTIDDLFLYFNGYFTGAPAADFNGVGGVTIDDLFLYINAYFTGC